MAMPETKLKNVRVIANANALLSKTIDRMSAIVNVKEDDKSLDSDDSSQSISDMQQLAHILLSDRLGQAIARQQ